VAEWLRSGLQSRVHRFKSGRRLHNSPVNRVIFFDRGFGRVSSVSRKLVERSVDAEPSRELVELLERAVAHVVRVILNTDDSSGLIGDVARDLLDLHAKACDAGVADPTRLARWMFRFRFADQDFFEADPVRYAKAPTTSFG
jgi:hypothetical protein